MNGYHDGYGDCAHWGEEPEVTIVNHGSQPTPLAQADGTSSDAFWHSGTRHDWKGLNYDLDTNNRIPTSGVLEEILKS